MDSAVGVDAWWFGAGAVLWGKDDFLEHLAVTRAMQRRIAQEQVEIVARALAAGRGWEEIATALRVEESFARRTFQAAADFKRVPISF